MKNKVFIIAEAGVNHNGSLMLAKRLVDAAKRSGADAIKFQTFKTENIVTRNAPQAAYQKKQYSYKTQFDMLKSLELSKAQFKELFFYCKKQNIMFLSTPFDYESARFLNKLGVSYFKISSGDITNIPLLRKIAGYKKPVILSTGMSTLEEVKEAVKAIYSKNNEKLILLHCTSNYPVKYKDVNLGAMDTLRKTFNVPVGYSDHTLGIEVAVAAVALGASVIEKHFTLDKQMEGPDHSASLEPHEFRFMVKSIRNIQTAIGSSVKKAQASETDTKSIARKSVVAANDIPRFAKITRKMLTVKRPGTGIEPKYLNEVVNSITKIKIKKDETLKWNKVKRR